jgi:hypothetical protein
MKKKFFSFSLHPKNELEKHFFNTSSSSPPPKKNKQKQKRVYKLFAFCIMITLFQFFFEVNDFEWMSSSFWMIVVGFFGPSNYFQSTNE